MAGGFHSTRPLYHKVALVARVTSKLPSALKIMNLKCLPSQEIVSGRFKIAFFSKPNVLHTREIMASTGYVTKPCVFFQ